MPQGKTLPAWASRPDEIIRAALLLSVLAHLAAAVFFKLPFPLLALEGRTALTLILLPRQLVDAPKPVTQTPPEPTPEEKPAPVTVIPTQPHEIAGPHPQQPASHPAPAQENPVKEELRALPANPVVENRIVQTAGQAQALLMVDEEGNVRQIIWKQLPAVSEEELKEMERRLRQRGHIARGELYTEPATIEIPRGP
jgi:hypothetical protein